MPSCGERKCPKPTGAGYKTSGGHPVQQKTVTIHEGVIERFRYNAEPVRITILGYPDPSKPNAVGLEQFEAATGYHIRTVPPSRFNNPTKVATGGGFLAVVESYGDSDLIRITDYHVGAPLDVGVAWDANGLPVPGFAWSRISDIDQVNVATVLQSKSDYSIDSSAPALTASTPRVSGIAITAYGLLIATLEGTPTVLIWDIKGAQTTPDGSPVAQYKRWCGAFVLPNVFASATLRGNPILHDLRKTDTFYNFAVAADWADTGATGVLVINTMQSQVVGAFPGPNGVSIGGVLTGNVLNHFISTQGLKNGAGQPIADTIIRSVYAGNDFFASGVQSDIATPTPTNQSVTKSFTVLDPYTDNETMSAVNKGAYLQNYQLSTGEASATLPISPGRSMPAGSTTGNLGPGPASVVSHTISNYGKAFQMDMPQIAINNPSDLNISSVNGLNNIVAYAYARKTDPLVNPLYTLLHGSHADWLSDGGFLYGCEASDGSGNVQGVTSGIQPIYIAVDRSAEPGSLVPLPDIKIGLFDIGTNLMVYTGAKSLGFRFYGGSSAGLALSSDYSDGEILATQCTLNEDMLIEQYDGILYTYARNNPAQTGSGTFDMRQQSFAQSLNFPSAIFNSNDGRTPWVLFVPRVTQKDKFSVVPVDDRQMATVDQDGHPLPWWGSLQTKNPVTKINASSQFYYPGTASTPVPTFFTDGGGGFFGLNWPKVALADGSGYATPEQILQYKIGPVQETPAGVDPGNTTPVQDDIEVILPLAPVFPGVAEGQEPQPLAVGTNIGTGANAGLERVVAFDTDVRSIVGITVNLDCGDFGASSWRTPQYATNFLGNPVPGQTGTINDPLDYNDLGISNSCIYDAGDNSGLLGSGDAVGIFEIEVFFNGQPAYSIAQAITDQNIIDDICPAEAGDVLTQIFNTDNKNNTNPDIASYLQGRVWLSEEVISTVTLKVRLINYASDVFRVGFQNLNFDQATTLDPDGYHFGPDPGFLDGINCAADLFGNTECLSFLLFGQVKLLPTDTLRTLVGNVLWEGTATYQMQDPYVAQGLSVGHLFIVNFTFDLNTSPSSYKVNLRQGYNAQMFVLPNL